MTIFLQNGKIVKIDFLDFTINGDFISTTLQLLPVRFFKGIYGVS